MKKTILVTGGTGYIGSHTVIALQEQGYNVIIVDNLSNSEEEVIYNIEKITHILPVFEKIDLVDEQACEALFNNYAIDAVIHFAAYKYVNESVNEPLRYYKNNFHSILNVLTEMQKHQIKNLVFSSSCTVYGTPDSLPVTENSPIKKAMSPYGNTKQVIEEVLEDCCKANNNLFVTSLRYFNPIGAHPSLKIGEVAKGIPPNLLPYLTQTVIGKREYLSVFGNDYDTPDGTCIRDYIHVSDLADAHVCAIQRMIEKNTISNYEVFNVGTGIGYSVLDIVHTFEKVNNLKVNYQIKGRREGDIAKIWADTRKANELLKWKAKYSLEDMLKTSWEWEKVMANKK
ncbi:MAG TPA: UDP-glucose 4-epimerase GalE [Bacteroidales bacterium]|jgi:UDP-glucose 4-epimerase|nr:UDP-glucose 4-epimerase GalE [Bacteroidales bacterium]HOF17101.1 UDP-glucose 4-epimerase GalE [Bacteroidales bacterium]HOR81767.1 UDP-glucose 4-epimerase GalE [Bacteroidales bacterium]HPJ92123.1 UDP-glucose 4-epimerase GalE [Bacteroidales bacterium]HPX59190.1 UDP-glucose 4-epimerase GalE [Bacteroidales bacterium]